MNFEALQAGSGSVHPSVWQHVSKRPPHREEFQRVIRNMRVGKAGGDDCTVAEYLKLAGETLSQHIFRFVCHSWQAAIASSPGQETSE